LTAISILVPGVFQTFFVSPQFVQFSSVPTEFKFKFKFKFKFVDSHSHC